MENTLVPLDEDIPQVLQPYLPPSRDTAWVTLTYAQSMDARISAAPGERTVISHAQTKTMTHYIRTKHDAILVGINTILADNPSLNCRYEEQEGGDRKKHGIRPVIIDPTFKFKQCILESKLIGNYKSGRGLKPVIIVSSKATSTESTYDIEIIKIEPQDGILPWEAILSELKNISLNSIMIEGGAHVINTLLNKPELVDSLIVTVGPVYLGSKGVSVSPPVAVTLRNVRWWTGIQDSVLCATLK